MGWQTENVLLNLWNTNDWKSFEYIEIVDFIVQNIGTDENRTRLESGRWYGPEK